MKELWVNLISPVDEVPVVDQPESVICEVKVKKWRIIDALSNVAERFGEGKMSLMRVPVVPSGVSPSISTECWSRGAWTHQSQ